MRHRPLESYLGEVGCWLALAFLWSGGGLLLAVLLGGLEFADLGRAMGSLWGVGLIYAFAAAHLLAGFYFLILIVLAHVRRGRIVREGVGGQIQVSPWAIRDLAREILRREVGLERFRVGLTRTLTGIKLRVEAELGREQSVSRVGEEVQRLLKEEVEERTGVEVAEVEVFIKGLSILPSKARTQIRTRAQARIQEQEEESESQGGRVE